MPPGFSWVDKPHVAGSALPRSADDLAWMRQNGVDVLVSLTEDPPPRRWVNDAGLLLVHVPVFDMQAPTGEQLDRAIDTIFQAKKAGMGVAVHCAAGLGRTGTVLAAYFVSQGLAADTAIDKVRRLRAGSVETGEQADAVRAFARRRNAAGGTE